MKISLWDWSGVTLLYVRCCGNHARILSTYLANTMDHFHRAKCCSASCGAMGSRQVQSLLQESALEKGALEAEAVSLPRLPVAGLRTSRSESSWALRQGCTRGGSVSFQGQENLSSSGWEEVPCCALDVTCLLKSPS